MAEISASLVKELREKTGVGMMDCKRALGETGGNLEEAVDWLRKKGLAAAAKKAGRVTAEGVVAVATGDRAGAVVELNSETDFVARNQRFQGVAHTLAEIALAGSGTLDDLKRATFPDGGQSVAETLVNLVATIGENMNLRRSARLSVEQGTVGSYVHSALAPGVGKIGVLVAVSCPVSHPRVVELSKQLAMHIAAARPDSVTVAEVDPAALERERDVLREQARASGKPEAIIDKMVEGRLRKYYEDVVLLEQVFVIDGESRVKDVVAKVAQEVKAPVTVTSFVRFALGEGIDRGEADFAAEVAAVGGAPKR